ncbi:MAG: hypothetical protein AAF467_01525 [Actinomycetota bacterium]
MASFVSSTAESSAPMPSTPPRRVMTATILPPVVAMAGAMATYALLAPARITSLTENQRFGVVTAVGLGVAVIGAGAGAVRPDLPGWSLRRRLHLAAATVGAFVLGLGLSLFLAMATVGPEPIVAVRDLEPAWWPASVVIALALAAGAGALAGAVSARLDWAVGALEPALVLLTAAAALFLTVYLGLSL